MKPRLPYVRDSHRAELAKRLRYLWTFELFDAALFPGLVLAVRLLTGEPMGAYAWAGAGLVSWMLLQGSVYWWLRLRTLRLASALPVG